MQQMPGGGSARELKKDIHPMGNILEKILALRPVTWKWKNGQDKATHYGFIAQELEEIFPHMITQGTWTDGTEHKFISPTDLTPYLVGAIKEQQQQIDTLTRQLEQALDNK